MELSSLIDYEFLYVLELRHPLTDAPLGITMQIRSAESDAVKKVMRDHADRNLDRLIKNKRSNSHQREMEALEKAAASIASWDWGKNTYDGKVPELTMKTAMTILEKEGWIYAQVFEASNKMENFSPASGKVSAEA